MKTWKELIINEIEELEQKKAKCLQTLKEIQENGVREDFGAAVSMMSNIKGLDETIDVLKSLLGKAVINGIE